VCLVVVAINMAMIVADLMAVTDAFSIIMDLPRSYFIAAIAFSVWYVLIFSRLSQDYPHAGYPFSAALYLCCRRSIRRPDWRQVISHSLFPRIPHDIGYPVTVIAVFGSLLTPYVLVWQTSSRREEALAGERFEGGSGGEHHAGAFVTTVLCIRLW